MAYSVKYRSMINFLATKDTCVAIERVCNKQYNFIVNFEIIAVYKSRNSCNKRIVKLFKSYNENV